ncbi:glycosyltransferase family 9 protein [Gulbenkiania mobilis]|uniref:glycosyltransferase family 9 protein n=1 Tax=Gulbenkiania mobilis TaxID=397457 RepID=UPI0009F93547|nr:glycosyltransferase family 9 protein [Gulbenkiania mobilis]
MKPRTPPSILVIRRDNIGDLVCTTPLLDALRQHFPGSRIAVVVNSYNAQVLDEHPAVNRVYVYTKLKHRRPGQSLMATVWQRLCMYRALRRERFDYAIVASSGYARNAVRLAMAARPRALIGFQPNNAPADPRITHPAPPHTKGTQCHEVEVLQQLLRPLGVTSPPGPLSVTIPSRERAAVAGLLPGNRPVIGLHISAREVSRVWPVALHIALIQALAARGVQTLLLWAPGSQEDPRHPGDDEKAHHILGQTDAIACPTNGLGKLLGAFAAVDVAVCSDGGGLHLAAAAGTPVVGLFEHLEKKYLHWYPWGVPKRVLTSQDRSAWQVAHISLDSVLQGCLALLEESGAWTAKGRA